MSSFLILQLIIAISTFSDSLSSFPPKALQLKMPFTISPWKDSEENVANLLMV